MNDPQALMCRIIKARYFPNSHFLDARLGRRPSFTWTSIFEAQGLLRKGVRWKVGNGANILVWGSPWINRGDDFFAQTPVVPGFEDLRVHDLFLPNTRRWDRNRITDIFVENEAKAILRTPISPEGIVDRLIWHYTKDGMYSVKSGYNLTISLVADESLEVTENWNIIWKLNVAPKIKDCLWRIYRNVIPNKVNLFNKHIVADKWCVLCGKDHETT